MHALFARPWSFLASSLAQDLRLAARLIWRDPAFSAMAVATLALGIGANTAIFSVINGAILTPLAFDHADRVVRIWQNNPGRNLPFFSVTPSDHAAWQESATTFDAFGAYDRQRAFVLTGQGQPEEIQGTRISGDLFALLGVSVAQGRAFLPEEDRPDGARVVIVSRGFADRRFGSADAILGRTLLLDGIAHAVVGVLPRGADIPNNPAELFLPLQLSRGQAEQAGGGHFLRVLARLRPGIAFQTGRAELERLAAARAAAFPDTNKGWGVAVHPLFDTVVGESFRHALLVLAGVVGLVLLIACANVASLLLARSASRRQELAIRVALGASRGRLVAQLFTESSLLALMAAGLALAVGAWGIQALQAMEPANVPRLGEIRIDRGVWLFTLAIATASALLFGTAPALRAARWDALPALKASGGTRGTTGHDRLRHLLVVGEVGLALVVLVGAGLMVQSLLSLRRVPLGFEHAGVLVADVNLPQSKYAATPATLFYEQLLERLSSQPGVMAAGAVSSAPFNGGNSAQTFLREGVSLPNTQAPDTDLRVVAGEYFRALRVPLRRGRVFDARDRDGATPVVIVSELTAARHWPGEDPIGRRLRIGDTQKSPLYTIVGVVGDMRYRALDDSDTRPMMYLPQSQTHTRSMTIVMSTRAAGDPTSLVDPLRQAVAAIDPDQPISRLATLSEVLSAVRAQSRFATSLFVMLGGLALVLAVVGLYGLMAWSVLERRRELGVRLALGATPRELIAMVLRRGLALALSGIGIGVILALALGRLLATMLVGIQPTDPWTIVAISIGLLIVAAIACLVPARRVLRLDPVRALRTE